MQIKLITFSKKENNAIDQLFAEYAGRLRHYINFTHLPLKAGTLSEEAAQVTKKAAGCELILLDEKGKQFSTVAFSEFMQRKLNTSSDICFVVGGAYGFDDEIKKSAKALISLSAMTLPHQLAKLFFIEQLYRAFTVIRNEKYHH